MPKKVAFNIASGASKVYILSGQKFIKNAKKCRILRVLENLKLAVKQYYQTGNFNATKIGKNAKFNYDILSYFQPLWPLETTEVMSFLKPPKIKVHTWFNPMFDVVQIGDIINLWILHPWKILLELDASFDAETHKHETTNSDGDPDNTERIDEPVVRIWKKAEKQLDQKF